MNKLLCFQKDDPSSAICRLLTGFALFHLVMAVAAGPFSMEGLRTIQFAECGLVTDFIATGGLSASFVNAALVTLLCVLFIRLSGSPYTGTSLASVIMTTGFCFFGINVVNMLPIMTGTWLYAFSRGEPFKKYVHVGFWACCAGPVVQYLAVYGHYSPAFNLFSGILLGIVCGFLVTGCASATAKAHEGMNLYNAGFASGIVLIGVSSIMKGFGYTFASVFTWNTEYKGMVALYICIMLAVWFLTGFLLNGNSFAGLWELGKQSGHRADFVKTEGLGTTMMNMSLTGLVGAVFILLIGGDPSGPVISGILSMFSFGAIGKHYRNVIWVIAGIVILSFFSNWNLTDPAVQFSALLGTCISPFAGKYGPFWGMVAGMIHISVVRHSGAFHSWLNLYNNGFAGGVTSVILLPFIRALKKEQN